ncbi:MAG TPA: glycosyltransferase family 39 protein [Thermoleophilaceae bacterium]
MTARRPNRSTVAALAGIVAAGAALRFATLDLQSLWIDEGATVRLLRGDLGHLLDGIPDTEKTPPLYYLLAWLWTRALGTGEVGVRSLSALVGVLTLPVVYSLGRELVSERAGLVAAALAAVNPLLVWYSQEARAYALLVLLAALATLFAVRAAPPRADWDAGAGGRRPLALWAVASSLALATHYFAIFVVLPLGAWLLLRAPDRRGAARASAGVAAAGLVLLPLAIDQSGNPGSNFIEGTALATRVAQVPKQLLLGYDAPLEAALTAAGAVLGAIGLALALTRTREGERSGALAAAALLAAAVGIPLVLALGGADLLLSRNLIAAVPALAVVLAAGFASRPAGLGAAAALCALSLVAVIAVLARPEYQRDDWRGVAEALGPAAAERAVVVNPVAGSVPLRLYASGLDEFPKALHPVSEIDLVAVASRRPGQTPRPPRPPAPTVPGFAPAARRETDTFTLIRLVAPRPTPISAAGLAALRLDEGLAVTLLQSPAR